MASFEISDKLVKRDEGGYANLWMDKGGETYMGIARNFWPAWSGWWNIDTYKLSFPKGIIPHNHIFNDATLNKLVKDFYKVNFWDKFKGDEIKSQKLANVVYSMFVVAGSNAIKQLQEALNGLKNNLTVDGVVGPATIKAINAAPEAKLHNDFKAQMEAFFRTRSTASTFLKGWLARLNNYPDLMDEKKSALQSS